MLILTRRGGETVHIGVDVTVSGNTKSKGQCAEGSAEGGASDGDDDGGGDGDGEPPNIAVSVTLVLGERRPSRKLSMSKIKPLAKSLLVVAELIAKWVNLFR